MSGLADLAGAGPDLGDLDNLQGPSFGARSKWRRRPCTELQRAACACARVASAVDRLLRLGNPNKSRSSPHAALSPSADPFADEALDAADAQATIKGKSYVHVRVQQRNGRKSLTTVQVFSHFCAFVLGGELTYALCLYLWVTIFR